MCGSDAIEDLLHRCPIHRSAQGLEHALILRVPELLGTSQPKGQRRGLPRPGQYLRAELAVETAAELGLTLACFVRGDHFTLYAHPERVLNGA